MSSHQLSHGPRCWTFVTGESSTTELLTTNFFYSIYILDFTHKNFKIEISHEQFEDSFSQVTIV